MRINLAVQMTWEVAIVQKLILIISIFQVHEDKSSSTDDQGGGYSPETNSGNIYISGSLG